MDVIESAEVIGRDGLRGVVESASPGGPGGEIRVRLSDGRQVLVPPGVLEPRPGGGYFLPLGAAELGRETQSTPPADAARSAHETVTIPVIAEELDVTKRTVETGRVRITKRVREREETVSEPLLREQVRVERVPVNRVVDGPVAVRYEGDTMIVPLMEEVLVVEKRLVLKEELRIRKHSFEVREPQQVVLRSEEATVERIGSDAPKGESGSGAP